MLIPHPKRVIVRPIEDYKKDGDGVRRSAGGIVLPDAAKSEVKKSQRGTVVSVNPCGALIGDCRIGLGRVIHYSAYSANEVTFNGETLAAVDLDDILAVEE